VTWKIFLPTKNRLEFKNLLNFHALLYQKLVEGKIKMPKFASGKAKI
jgi:hypothetical protein